MNPTPASNPLAVDPPLPDLTTAEAMLLGALGQIAWARRYTLELLAATPRELWFESPRFGQLGAEADSSAGVVPSHSGGQPGDQAPGRAVTNIAWQVGHLAVSQYGLLMFRIHGRRDDDLELVPGKFRKTFSRGSDPSSPSVAQYSADELLDRFDRIHQSALLGLTSGFDPRVLLEPVDMPYAVYPIKLGGVLFCPLHEQIHSGQIGLIRRGLGLAPVR